MNYNKIMKMQDEDFYDDCPICQALKKAKEEGREITTEEYIKASEKAKEQGAITGGPLLQKPYKA